MKPQASMQPENKDETKRLLAIMARLRDPESGCPWDIEQDFASIVPYTLEEAYEVADAIQREDLAALKEELGDLLLQVAFHSQMAAEAGHFTFEDVAHAICEKMVSRHPHVFGDATIKTADEQSSAWENYKQRERTEKQKTSALDDVPHAFPALLRAEKLQKRAAKTGFDWPNAAPVFDKIEEEIQEVKVAINNKDQQNIEEELGDLLFAVVNLARHLSVNAETALRQANYKFETRFRAMETLTKAQQQTLNDLSLEEMERLWQQVKHASSGK